jgi:hypothetical protein
VIDVLIGLGVLWLVMMPIWPGRFVGGEVMESVGIVIKMSRVVKTLKTKDDLLPQTDLFQKLNT